MHLRTQLWPTFHRINNTPNYVVAVWDMVNSRSQKNCRIKTNLKDITNILH